MAICARWWNCVAEMQSWVAVEQLFSATVALWAQPSRHGPWAEAYGKSSAVAHLDLAARLTVSQTHTLILRFIFCGRTGTSHDTCDDVWHSGVAERTEERVAARVMNWFKSKRLQGLSSFLLIGANI